MADDELHQPPKRRLSFRRSVVEADLPAGYLDALEQKRKALDDSIHKYIASKEREFKQYEKELRQHAKKSEADERVQQEHANTGTASSSVSTVDALLRTDGRKRLYDNTAENDFGGGQNEKHTEQQQERKKREDFQGLFTPGYLSALEHAVPERTVSEPALDSCVVAIVSRTNSDSAAETQRPTRVALTQRTSSSGSSIDGRLVSALKSTADGTAKTKRKRVSLAVGDAIVAPSDNVPNSMAVNNTLSHSRSRSASSRQPAVAAENEPQGLPVSAAVLTLQEQGSASAASQTDELRANTIIAQNMDTVGDMFDLEADEMDFDEEARQDASPEEHFESEIIGRVSSLSPQKIEQDDIVEQAQEHAIELGEPPPDIADAVQSTALSFAEGPSTSKQPLSPGFRRPSAMLDPVYPGQDYMTVERTVEENSYYGSSFSRGSKGSFLSSSAGESYMAENAASMMKMRTEQQTRPQPSRQSSRVLPVR